MKIEKNISIPTYDAVHMHQYNKNLIFNLFRTQGELSRAELTRITKMSPTNVGKIIAMLEEEGLIIKTRLTEEGLGRKAVLYTINPEGGYVIGVDIDLYSISVGLVNLCGELEQKVVEEKVPIENPKEVGKIISNMIDSLTQNLTEEMIGKLIGVGIIVPGLVEWPKGKIIFSPQLCWHNVDLFREISLRYDVPIFLDNNVNAAAIAEILFGKGKKYTDFYIIQFGSGIGSALVLDNKVIRGKSNVLGEVGHVLLIPDGNKCECGRRGCFEAYCGMSSLEQETGISFDMIMCRYKEGEKKYVELLDRVEKYISMLLSNAVNVYNPSLILLYGKMLESWPELFDIVSKKYKEYLWQPDYMDTTIVKSDFLHSDISIKAAAALPLNECCYNS